MKKKFDIVFTKQFLKEIRNLDRPTQIRVLRELRILEEQPLLGKRLAGQLIGLCLFESEIIESSIKSLRRHSLFEQLVTVVQSMRNSYNNQTALNYYHKYPKTSTVNKHLNLTLCLTQNLKKLLVRY